MSYPEKGINYLPFSGYFLSVLQVKISFDCSLFN